MGAVSYAIYMWSPALPETSPEISQTEVADQTESDVSEEPAAQEIAPAPFQENIQVEILNGCGFNGVAKIFQDYLRAQGFDVVNTDNYMEDGKLRWDIQNSFVIDRVGQIEQAMAVARSLSIPRENIISKENPDAIYDVSVVIGKDFKNLAGSN